MRPTNLKGGVNGLILSHLRRQSSALKLAQ